MSFNFKNALFINVITLIIATTFIYFVGEINDSSIISCRRAYWIKWLQK